MQADVRRAVEGGLREGRSPVRPSLQLSVRLQSNVFCRLPRAMLAACKLLLTTDLLMYCIMMYYAESSWKWLKTRAAAATKVLTQKPRLQQWRQKLATKRRYPSYAPPPFGADLSCLYQCADVLNKKIGDEKLSRQIVVGVRQLSQRSRLAFD